MKKREKYAIAIFSIVFIAVCFFLLAKFTGLFIKPIYYSDFAINVVYEPETPIMETKFPFDSVKMKVVVDYVLKKGAFPCSPTLDVSIIGPYSKGERKNIGSSGKEIFEFTPNVPGYYILHVQISPVIVCSDPYLGGGRPVTIQDTNPADNTFKKEFRIYIPSSKNCLYTCKKESKELCIPEYYKYKKTITEKIENWTVYEVPHYSIEKCSDACFDGECTKNTCPAEYPIMKKEECTKLFLNGTRAKCESTSFEIDLPVYSKNPEVLGNVFLDAAINQIRLEQNPKFFYAGWAIEPDESTGEKGIKCVEYKKFAVGKMCTEAVATCRRVYRTWCGEELCRFGKFVRHEKCGDKKRAVCETNSMSWRFATIGAKKAREENPCAKLGIVAGLALNKLVNIKNAFEGYTFETTFNKCRKDIFSHHLGVGLGRYCIESRVGERVIVYSSNNKEASCPGKTKLLAKEKAIAEYSSLHKCKKIIDNGDSSTRADIVFAGSGFANDNEFLSSVKRAISYDGKGEGIFSVEPFKLNKDLFNIWIVEGANKTFRDSTMAHVEGREILKHCPESDYTFFLVRKPKFQTLAIGPTKEVISSYPWDDDRLIVHEFGHAFGKLADEYDYIETFGLSFEVPPEFEKIVSSIMRFGIEEAKNCAPKEQAEKNWGNLVGQGEGQLKIGYYKGCYIYKDFFRPTENSIMRHRWEVPKKLWERGFGLYNEKIIKQEIEKWKAALPICGNKICEAGETAGNCPQDCKIVKQKLLCQKIYTTAWQIYPCNPKDCGKNKYVGCEEKKFWQRRYYREKCSAEYWTKCGEKCAAGYSEIERKSC